MIIPDALINQLISNPVFKTDTRAIFFLLQNPEPVSVDDIATATGLSRKCANKAVKRLTGAGLIQPGEPEARRRTFGVTGGEPIESPAVTKKDDQYPVSLLAEKIDRIEALLNILLERPAGGSASAPATDGQNEIKKVSFLSCIKNSEPVNDPNGIEAGHKVTQAVTISAPAEEQKNTQAGTMPVNGQDETGTMPVCSQIDEHKNMQDKKEALIIPNRTIVTGTGTNEPQNDSIMADLDNAIIRAHARQAALKAASLLKEKQSSFSSTCAPASIGEVFKSLFGVKLPAGSDPAAVETMVNRKKAGKLDNVKSPLAYLASLAGKVQSPIITTPTPPPANKQLPPVTEPPTLDHETIDRINRMWDSMTGEQKMPYQDKALPKFTQQTGRYLVPLELLARQAFNTEQLKAAGGQFG